jgi:hypothetical protein
LPPGEATIFVGDVTAGDDAKWIGAPGEVDSRTFVTIEDEKTTKLELPVIDLKSAKITGTFEVAPANEQKSHSDAAHKPGSVNAPENEPAGQLKSAPPLPAREPAGAAPVKVPATNSRPADGSATATLTGHVTGPNGKPVGSATVSLARNTWPVSLEDATASHTTTDSAGNFKLERLQPFDLNDYYEQVDEQKRRSNDGNILFAAPAILTVAAPGFATKPIAPKQIPGNQDVQLEAPAIIEGRVAFEGNEREAGNVLVQAVSILTGESTPSIFPDFHMPVRAEVRTGPDGKYRFTNLGPGSFYVSATAPGWTTNGIPCMSPDHGTTIDKPTQMPDIIFTRGGIVAVRMIDTKTNKPIELQPGMQAMLDRSSATNPPTGQNAHENSVAANGQGRFETRVPAGKWTILADWINSPRGEAIWIGHERVPVDIVAGQTIEIDAPVETIK